MLDELHHRLQLLFVIGRFCHRLPHNQQQLRLYRRLRIEALHKPVAAFHDARLRIGEVVLILILGLGPVSCRNRRSNWNYKQSLTIARWLARFGAGMQQVDQRFPPIRPSGSNESGMKSDLTNGN